MMALVPALALVALTASGPDAPRIAVSLAEASPVLGVHDETELRIVVTGAAEAIVPEPRLLASVGRIEELMRTGPAEFTARYVLPAERFPQVAILAAELPGAPAPLRGFTIARLRAAASPSFRTDPGASVTLRIADKEFGPVRAARDGTVRLPVVVPPGIGFALARSVNAHGRSTEQMVDLKVPEFSRLFVVAPETIAAGGVAEVAVYAVESSGRPASPVGVRLTVGTARGEPLGGRLGEARFLVHAPTDVTGHPLSLEAVFRGEPATAHGATMNLVPGPPARLTLRPDRSRLPIGAGSTMRVQLAAEDTYGNRLDPTAAQVRADGAEAPIRHTEDGRVMAIVAAPPVWRGRDRVRVEGRLGAASAAIDVPLANLPAARAAAPAEPLLTVTPRVGFVWNLRQAPGPALVVEAFLRRPHWPARLVAGVSGAWMTSEVAAVGAGGVSRARIHQAPILASFRVRHRPRPRLLLSVGAGAGLTIASARVRSFGYDVEGRDVAPAVELAGEAALILRGGHVVAGSRVLFAPLGGLSSGDTIAGNSAGLVADVGYRILW